MNPPHSLTLEGPLGFRNKMSSDKCHRWIPPGFSDWIVPHWYKMGPKNNYKRGYITPLKGVIFLPSYPFICAPKITPVVTTRGPSCKGFRINPPYRVIYFQPFIGAKNNSNCDDRLGILGYQGWAQSPVPDRRQAPPFGRPSNSCRTSLKRLAGHWFL